MVRCGKPIAGLECNRSLGHGGPCDPAVIFWYDHLKQVGASYVPRRKGKEMTLKDQLQAAGKAIAGAVAGAIVSVLSTTVTDPNAAINPDAPPGANAIVQLPNTTAEWTSFAAAIVIGFVLPYVKRNYPSVPAAAAQLETARNRVADGKQSQ